jgi:hypothetical protein
VPLADAPYLDAKQQVEAFKLGENMLQRRFVHGLALACRLPAPPADGLVRPLSPMVSAMTSDQASLAVPFNRLIGIPAC